MTFTEKVSKIQAELKAPKRPSTLISCRSCQKEMHIRNDYIKKHSGFCMSCQKKNNSNALKHGDYKKRIYKIWQGLFQRRYKHTVEVCNKWHDYTAFKEWALSHGYDESMTIDRIDNNLGYSPDNCQWIPLAENAGKDKRIFSIDDKRFHFANRKKLKMTQRDYAAMNGVSRNTIQRLEKELKRCEP